MDCARGRDALERLARRRDRRRQQRRAPSPGPLARAGGRRLPPGRPPRARAVPRGRHQQLLPADAAREQRALAGQPAADLAGGSRGQRRRAQRQVERPRLRGPGAAPALLSLVHEGVLAHGQPEAPREALLQEQSQVRRTAAAAAAEAAAAEAAAAEAAAASEAAAAAEAAAATAAAAAAGAPEGGAEEAAREGGGAREPGAPARGRALLRQASPAPRWSQGQGRAAATAAAADRGDVSGCAGEREVEGGGRRE